MNQYSEENILTFLNDLLGREIINLQTDIFKDQNVWGDDFHEMIEKYQIKFKVDMSSYLWYFHSNEEGQSLGAALFTPPYDRVKRIPVTPKMLLDFANSGKWTVIYPKHHIPQKHYDLLINTVLVLSLFIILIIYLLNKFVCN